MYCSNCGQALAEGVGICPHCNTAQAGSPHLKKLSDKIKTEAYVWLGVAALQVIIGLVLIIQGIQLNADYEDGTAKIINGALVLLVAAANGLSSKKSIQYSSTILTNPVGIVQKYKPWKELLANLIYNLVLGGIVGVIGTAFGYLTRQYVMTHEAAFMELENKTKEGINQ